MKRTVYLATLWIIVLYGLFYTTLSLVLLKAPVEVYWEVFIVNLAVIFIFGIRLLMVSKLSIELNVIPKNRIFKWLYKLSVALLFLAYLSILYMLYQVYGLFNADEGSLDKFDIGFRFFSLSYKPYMLFIISIIIFELSKHFDREFNSYKEKSWNKS